MGGATFEMSCKAFPENLDDPGFSVEIQWQDGLGGDNKTIMTLNPDNVMQHGPGTEPNRRYAVRARFYLICCTGVQRLWVS